MAVNTLWIIGNIILILGPLVIALYYETRFTQKVNMIGYGAASIAFGLIFFSDPIFFMDPSTTPTPSIFERLSEIQTPGLSLFLVYGLIGLLIGLKIRKGHEKAWTLIFSGKYFAALQIPFTYTQISIGQMSYATVMTLLEHLLVGAILVIVFTVLSRLIKKKKNE